MAEPTLQRGAHGSAVRDLQDALSQLGFDPGPVDGLFGARTEAAVMRFQRHHDLPADGIVGPITWRNIDEADQSEPILKNGSIGLPVRRLQHRMTAAGFETGGVDGRFGTRTERAVRQLQRHAGLAVDGIVGPRTWAVVDALEDEGGAS